jgi:hypothetical protein
MRHTTMNASSYGCPSYTWLPSHPVHEIDINGSALENGDNLYQFLHRYRTCQRYRRQFPSRFNDDAYCNSTPPWIDAILIDQTDVHTFGGSSSFWIDAICIYQATVKEKDHLVQFLDWVQSFGNRITRDTSPEDCLIIMQGKK